MPRQSYLCITTGLISTLGCMHARTPVLIPTAEKHTLFALNLSR